MAAVSNRKKPGRKPSGSRIAGLIILIMIIGAVAGYFLSPAPGKKEISLQKKEGIRIPPAPDSPAVVIPHTSPPPPPVVTKQPPSETYPDTEVIPETVKPDTQKGGARLAIIIDDMGGSLSEARSLASIGVPLTFAIIPGLRFDKDVAAYAVSHKIETMIHIPMQSKGWPERRLEKNGFLVSMETGELQGRISDFIKQFPEAVGANNHMGSEFTEHEEKMSAVLQVLKQNDLFFIDSVTSPASTGLKVARQLRIRSARRNVFLDNEQERGYILSQLGQAVRQARKSGTAIAICHPHPATISALAKALPELTSQGVSLVSASQLVR